MDKVIIVGAGNIGLELAAQVAIWPGCNVEIISPEQAKEKYDFIEKLAFKIEPLPQFLEIKDLYRPPTTRRERRAKNRKNAR